MKIFKKIAGIILALFMVLQVTTNAFAAKATTNSLTVKNTGKTAHKFELYQIFKGDLSNSEGKLKLSNIQWGDGVTDMDSFEFESTKGADKIAEKLNGGNAENFAQEIAKKLDSNNKKESGEVQAGQTYKFDKLNPGYYLVKDADGSQEGSEDKKDSAYTLYILKVVGDVEAQTKLDVPKVEKFVKDINDSEDADGIENNDWQKSADHDIGDDVDFKLEGTLPDNIDKYSKYEYIFHDEGSKGLTLKEDTISVYIQKKGNSKTQLSKDSQYSVVVKENKFDVKFTDLKSTIPQITKEDKIVVEYKATLNQNAIIGKEGNPNEVYLEYSNNPNGEGKGQTPKDKVIVFTYKTIVNKKNEKKEDLEGAGFTLYKKIKGKDSISDSWKPIGEEKKGPKMTKFEFEGLDDGDYKLVETTVPSGYNKMADLLFTITATHDEKVGTKEALTELNGSVENGLIKFTPNVEEGSLSADVENKPGSILPETGGLGTKLLYILGTIFTIVAVGYLFAEKKVLRNQNR